MGGVRAQLRRDLGLRLGTSVRLEERAHWGEYWGYVWEPMIRREERRSIEGQREQLRLPACQSPCRPIELLMDPAAPLNNNDREESNVGL